MMNPLLRRKPSVVLVSAEAFPFAGTRSSAAGMQALPESLARLGFDVCLVTPKYRRPAIEALPLTPVLRRFLVPVGKDKVPASSFRAETAISPLPPVDFSAVPDPPARRFRVYFIDNVKYFDRERIFGSEKAPYLDNDERFTFFCRAVVEFLRRARIRIDILHCHDWPSALIPLFLRTAYDGQRPFRKTASVLTVHDPAFQGDFPPESFALTGLAWDLFTPERLAAGGRFNFLAAGLLFADGLCAGDEAAAEAVRTGEAGAELTAVLARRGIWDGGGSGREKAAGSGAEVRSKDRAEFAVPASGRDVAEVYRRALISRKGDSHAR